MKIIKRLFRRLANYFVAFVLFVIIFFIIMYRMNSSTQTTFSEVESQTIPLIYAEVFGMKANSIPGYTQEEDVQKITDSLIVLPQDRRLKLYIKEFDSQIIQLSYEVRNIDLSHLIERTSIGEISSGVEYSYASLPIQSLIKREQEYYLIIKTVTTDQTINYYTKIIWPESTKGQEMFETALSFHNKTFDYDEARSLTNYMESSLNEKNNDLSHVSLTSNFSQLTWASTKMQQIGEANIYIKSYSGISEQIKFCFYTKGIGQTGLEEYFYNEEEFIIRWGQKKIYIMSYDRNTTELFTPNEQTFDKKKINLGITNLSDVDIAYSFTNNFVVFKKHDEIWRYDTERNLLTCIFTFRKDLEIQDHFFDNHDIKILNCENNGDVDFLYYGYVFSGPNEGNNGIVYYTYDNSEDELLEKFFFSCPLRFENIKYDLNQLTYNSAKGVLYFIYEDKVIGINTNNKEVVQVCENLAENTYAISNDKTHIAWENGEKYNCHEIKVYNLEEGTQVTVEDNVNCIRVMSMVGGDLLYGVANESDLWIENGWALELPVSEILVVNSNLEVVNTYTKEDRYFTVREIDGNRTRFNVYQKVSQNRYKNVGDDTLIGNSTNVINKSSYFESKKIQGKQNVKLITMPNRLDDTEVPQAYVINEISYTNTSLISGEGLVRDIKTETYFSYTCGSLIKKTSLLSQAIESIYDEFGYVYDLEGNLMWSRPDRDDVRFVNPADKLAADYLEPYVDDFTGTQMVKDDLLIINGFGMKVEYLLYYISRGIPVYAFKTDGQDEYISGYDQVNVRITSKQGQRTFLAKEKAEERFSQSGSNFLIAMTTTNQ